MMNENSKAIITFCSHLCAGKDVRPLETKEWNTLAEKLVKSNMTPRDLLSFGERDIIEVLDESAENAQRLRRLVDRSVSLAFEITDIVSKGIHVVTRADEEYPKQLKRKLKRSCPPLFYCAGDLSILNCKAVGYVGSRKITPEDAEFAADTVAKTVANRYAVVSGGAKGIDTISTETAINNGGFAIEYLGDSMIKRMREPRILTAIQDGQLLLLSAVNPDAGFFAGNLMARNKFIYAQSDGTVIVRSEKKGGTWSGANENLKHGWCPSFCWDKVEYEGNQELIRLGCKPINNNWNARIEPADNRTVESPAEINTKLVNCDEQLRLPEFN